MLFARLADSFSSIPENNSDDSLTVHLLKSLRTLIPFSVKTDISLLLSDGSSSLFIIFSDKSLSAICVTAPFERPNARAHSPIETDPFSEIIRISLSSEYERFPHGKQSFAFRDTLEQSCIKSVSSLLNTTIVRPNIIIVTITIFAQSVNLIFLFRYENNLRLSPQSGLMVLRKINVRTERRTVRQNR